MIFEIAKFLDFVYKFTIYQHLFFQKVMMSGRNFLRAVPRAVSRRALNFNLSEDSLALQEVARKFAREEMLPKAAHYDKTMEYPQDIFTAAWELGLGKLFLNSPQRES